MKPAFRVSGRIGRSCEETFDAVVNPGKLSAYFTTVGGASAPLAAGTTVIWWDNVPVDVDEVIPNRRIVLRWDGDGSANARPSEKTRIEMNFAALDDGATLITIAESGWEDDAQGRRASYVNCEGWTQMLCCMKAYLEYGVNLREGFYQSELEGVPAGNTINDNLKGSQS